MPPTVPINSRPFNRVGALSAADRLADQIRRRRLTREARYLCRVADIRPHIAAITAEAMGLGEGDQ